MVFVGAGRFNLITAYRASSIAKEGRQYFEGAPDAQEEVGRIEGVSSGGERSESAVVLDVTGTIFSPAV